MSKTFKKTWLFLRVCYVSLSSHRHQVCVVCNPLSHRYQVITWNNPLEVTLKYSLKDLNRRHHGSYEDWKSHTNLKVPLSCTWMYKRFHIIFKKEKHPKTTSNNLKTKNIITSIEALRICLTSPCVFRIRHTMFKSLNIDFLLFIFFKKKKKKKTLLSNTNK